MFGIPTLFVVFAISAVPSSEPAARPNIPPPEMRLLQFGSSNCSVCAKIKPSIDDFVEKKWPIQYVNAYENRELAKKYQIEEIPTFIMLIGETEVDRLVGVLDQAELQNQLIEMFKKAAELRKQESDKKPSQILRGTSDVNQTLGGSATNHGFSQPSSAAQASYTSPISFQQQPPQQQYPQHQHLNGEPKVDSTVRIRVDDPKGLSWGTGTIIDTYNGEALILTCGHIFRESQGKGPVEVHLFRENSFFKVYGECDAYDLDVDLGLVVIKNIPFPVQATPIAPADTLREGQKLLSVGCDGGANPSVREHTILSLNRFGTASNAPQPFHYIQVSGAPVQGRSGGGLFSEDGFLVGVCNTGDPKTNDGLFVPLSVIRAQLDAKGLSAVYQSPSVVDPRTAADTRAVDPRAMTASQNPTATDTSPFAPIPTSSIAANPAPAIANPASPLQNGQQPIITASNAGEQSLPKAKIALAANDTPREELSETEIATLEEIRRRRADGAEVILIVNPPRKGNETPQSEVIKLGDVSGRFIDALTERDVYSTAEPMPSLTEQAAAIARSNLGQGQGNKPSVPSRQREATVRALR